MDTYEIIEEIRKEQLTAVASATLSVPDIGPWLSKVYGTVASTVIAQGATLAGPPFARYHPLGDGRFDVQAGFPVTAPLTPTDEVQAATLPAGPAAATIHIGPYESMEPAYRSLTHWITTHNATPTGDPWEIYFSDPTTHPDPTTWRTEVVQPYTPTKPPDPTPQPQQASRPPNRNPTQQAGQPLNPTQQVSQPPNPTPNR